MLQSQPVSGIMQYLMETHQPRAIIITGSYAEGSFDETSDFDCWLIGRDETLIRHDTSTVNGVMLQAEIYPLSQMKALPERYMNYFVEVLIPYDPEGVAEEFMAHVRRRLAKIPCMPQAHKQQRMRYLDKMLRRAGKQDFPGDVRGHLMLYQSLQHWCEFTDRLYIGTRKTLRMMEQEDPESASLFRQALRSFHLEDMKAWIERLRILARQDSGRIYCMLPPGLGEEA